MLDSNLLVEESLKLFFKKGFRFTMDEVAGELHISKRTLYEQVESKEDLLRMIMNHFTKELDEYYVDICKDTHMSEIEKFEKLLIKEVKETSFVLEHITEFKSDYPELYNEYLSLIDNRWEDNFAILGNYLNSNKMLFDKKIFKTMYSSVIKEIIIESYSDIELENNLKQIVKILINGLNSTLLGKISNKEIIDLLGKISSGILLFSLGEGAKPLYLSDSFLKFYSPNEVTMKSDLLSFIDERDREKIIKVLKTIHSTDDVTEIRYRINTKDGLKWHHMVLAKIESLSTENLFLAIVIDETDNILKKDLLKFNEERLRIAFEQTNIGIWEYDVIAKNLQISPNVLELLGIKEDTKKYVFEDEYINENIHPDSIENYKKFYYNICNGKSEENCVIQEKDGNGNYIWTKRSYKTIFDEDNNPLRVIGILQKINYIADVKARFEEEEKVLDLAKDDILLSVKFNISKNKIESVVNNGKLSKYSNLDGIEYEKFNDLLLENFANKEDKKRFLDIYSFEKVEEISQASQASTHINFRFIGIDNVKWLSYTGNYLIEPLTGDRYLFTYLRDIDEKTKLELEFDKKVEYDVTTRLYIESSMRNLTNFAISKQNNFNKKCAMAVLEINNFANIKIQFGLDIAEKILFYIGRILRICFNNKNIVGRVADNQFAIFFPKVNDYLEVEDKLSNAIAMAHDSYFLTTEEKHVASIKVSVCFSKNEHIYYENLYNQCLKKLVNIRDDREIDIIDNKDVFENKEILFEKNMISNKNIEGDSLEKLKQISSLKTYVERIALILSVTNDYYQSLMTSVFCFEDYGKKLLLKYEKHALSRKDFDKITLSEKEIPGFYSYMSSGKPIILNNIETISKEYPIDYEFLKGYGINSIYILPLVERNAKIGYLCVSNLVSHIGELRLLNHVSTILTGEVVKAYLLKKTEDYQSMDKLTNSFNHDTFIRHINEYKTKPVNTLGLVSVKINNLRQINFEYSMEYGDEVLISIGNILKKEFNSQNVYRTEGDRFDVILPDVDYKKFSLLTDNVKNEINSIKNDIASVYNLWNDVDIDVDKMYNNLDEIIEVNKKNIPLIMNINDDFKYSMKYSLENKYFGIKLQPKFDLNTNEIIGAEALSRLKHPELGSVPPSKFVPALERENLIGELDLYVLEEVCKMLKNWKDNNKKLIPISVNYSRSTLLETNIIERTLSIIEKYNVDRQLLFIEITESIGNLEQMKIAEIANKFIKNNIKLSIDDFGSKYSSLSVLSLIPFSEVKLDKSIVNDLVVNQRSQVIIEHIIAMSKKMGMIVVAEGIETELQLQTLKEKKCDWGQGYLFEKPISVIDFEKKYNSK